MRKIVVIVICICGMTQFVVGEQTIYSFFAKSSIVIDGHDAESVWNLADSVSFNGMGCQSDNVVVVKSLWDENFLYFVFKISDTNLQARQTKQDHPALFLDDMVELLIDMTNDRDSCWNENKIIYHINLLGAKKDDKGTACCSSDPVWNGNALYSVKTFGTVNEPNDIDEGYNVEIALPWLELGRIPVENVVLGVNFANGDNDDNGRQLFDWLGIFPFRSPHLFGSLILKKTQN